MKKILFAASLLTACYGNAFALENSIKVTSTGVNNGKPIAEKFAFCKKGGKGKTMPADNISPQLSWSGAPKETESFAIVAVDPDVPAKFDDANKEGKTIAKDFPRQNFYHWVAVDIPASVTEIPEGQGKNFKDAVMLLNSYGAEAKFIGYDGPCPPWNDERVHNYHFTVYALDVEKTGIKPGSSGKDAIAAIEKHAIARGELVGTYSNF